MARSGSASRPTKRSSETRSALVDAAVEVLRSDGFAKATARTIADKAGCNQKLAHDLPGQSRAGAHITHVVSAAQVPPGSVGENHVLSELQGPPGRTNKGLVPRGVNRCAWR